MPVSWERIPVWDGSAEIANHAMKADTRENRFKSIIVIRLRFLKDQQESRNTRDDAPEGSRQANEEWKEEKPPPLDLKLPREGTPADSRGPHIRGGRRKRNAVNEDIKALREKTVLEGANRNNIHGKRRSSNIIQASRRKAGK